jgi:hypothetical protein
MSIALLGGAFRPTTDVTGLLHAPCEIVVEHVKQWRSELQFREDVQHVYGSLDDVLSKLLPLETFSSRDVIVPAKNGWTVYWSNGWRGTDASAFVGFLHKRLRCKGLRICCSPHTIRRENGAYRGTYGANILEVFSPNSEDQLGYERTLTVANDGGKWVFASSGTPYDFEEVQKYRAARIKDRFTSNMLVTYLENLGVQPFDSGFYLVDSNQPAYLFQNLRLSPSGQRNYTLGEIQATL